MLPPDVHHIEPAQAHVAVHRRMRKAVASWYGPGLWGNRLGCGGVLHRWTLGVANKTLRCGTRLRICYTRCVSIRVVDRGPYVAGRTFDLTMRTRFAVGMPNGVHTIRYRITR